MPTKFRTATILLFATFSCFAQEFEKQGLPCVAELCVGDGIAELLKIQWDRARNPFSDPKKPLYISTQKVDDGELNIVKSKYRGDVVPVASFLYAGMFDSATLASLSRITAACSPHKLTGTYATPSGNPTTVDIRLIPNQDDTTKHRWTVVSITRSFPKAISNEQKAEVRSQIDQRYAAFDARKPMNSRAEKGSFMWSIFLFEFSLFLNRNELAEANRMKLHPACGGTEKVRID